MINGRKILAASDNAIRIHGAREHNLKNLSVSIPRNQFVVITGVSGSGKSTLAFDILFAEGQRRFLDSMNVYVRQFVEQLSRPEVDLITGIPPTVSIEQRNSRGGGKSTVATVTEIYHFIRLLFARLGTQYCPDCDLPVEAQTRDQLGKKLREEMKRRGDLLLLAPVVKNRKGFHTDVAAWAAKHGYAEVRADGKIYSTSERLRLDRFREHDVEIVVGILDKKVGQASPLPLRKIGKSSAPLSKTAQQLIDEALRLGNGTLFALSNDQKVSIHSIHRACPGCGQSFEKLDPKNFSYNSSQGWCPKCRGFGELFYLPEVERGARADAIEESWFEWQEGKREICPECNGARLNPVARTVRLNVGQASSLPIPSMSTNHAAPKKGRLEASPTIIDIGNASVDSALKFFCTLKFKGRDKEIARDILPEIRERLKFLCEVGLGYLQLGRGATTLSGGEAQRIRLAAQLGSNLSGVLYILDEPTIGLHARDNEQLLSALEILKSRGNSLVVVEHDEETMRHADHVIDLGPGAGVHGGEIVATGTLKELMRHRDSITGSCLREKKCFPHSGKRRPVSVGADVRRLTSKKIGGGKSQSLVTSAATNYWLTLQNASVHNLKNLSVSFPLNRFVVVTGVSGSGKSTLVRECLLPMLQAKVRSKKNNAEKTSAADSPALQNMKLRGFESIQSVYEVDQAPIGRTPRSIPATYVGFFDDIRQLFAQMPEARMRGYSASRFSFNSAQGRCPECEGAGTIKLEMNFLPPAFVRCETCGGCRFNRETLDVEFAGKNIAQILDLSVAEAIDFFAAQTRIRRPLEALRDTGLDYIKLGQTSPTLSGGEAQRMKLVTHLLSGFRNQKLDAKIQTKKQAELELARETRKPGSSIFILEEPTIGLHMADVRKLVEVLQRLVDSGHSVIVIEHNLDLIAEADWVIDLGPEGGTAGGEIVAQGTPEEIAANRRSHTGRFLRKVLKNV